jgi:hypothetical protein
MRFRSRSTAFLHAVLRLRPRPHRCQEQENAAEPWKGRCRRYSVLFREGNSFSAENIRYRELITRLPSARLLGSVGQSAHGANGRCD